jgi:putative lipoic acid-binding regulatory protein
MTESTLLEFPCDFPIKVMGPATEEFRSLVLGILSRHFGVLPPERIEERPSRGGRYVGLTVTVVAESKTQLDAAYGDLTACSQVLFAL